MSDLKRDEIPRSRSSVLPPASTAREVCALCSKNQARNSMIPANGLRPQLVEYMGCQDDSQGDVWVCASCLKKKRTEFIAGRLAAERGVLTLVEEEIARRAADHRTIARDIGAQFESAATRGERIADAVARIGGSWTFVLGFFGFLILWMFINVQLTRRGGAFDPYPFILLNLVLSCIAAMQAPIIMMAQNRSSIRDRKQADEDFRVNLKAELEIGTLHEKVDHLLNSQFERIVEIQEIQLEMLDELRAGLIPAKPETMRPPTA